MAPTRLDTAEAIDLVGSARCMAATMAGCGLPSRGGADAMILGTPATLAVSTDMWADATHRELPSGHVTADGPNGNVAVAEDDAMQGFDFNIGNRCALRFGKSTDLRLREADVFHVPGGNPLHCRLDIGR